MHNRTLRRTLLLLMCVLVFLFALRAKTAVYNGGAPAKVTPTTASKLWLSVQKMELQSADASGGVLFCVAVLCLFGLSLRREPRVQRILVTPAPNNISQHYLHRFLRPPPFQA